MRHAGRLLQALVLALLDAGCEVRGDEAACAADARVRQAMEADWHTEYLDAIISVKLVPGVRGAIDHIAKYGSQHTKFDCDWGCQRSRNLPARGG